MSEVLITLGIIGVVAALTLPALVQNYRNKVVETQFKKSYSMISQAFTSVIMEDYGGFVNFNSSSLTELIEGVKGRYKGADTSWSMLAYPNNTAVARCYFMGDTYKTYNGNRTDGRFNDGIIQLMDGSTVFFDVGTEGDFIGKTILVGIDVNGWKNKPNQFGRDFFAFQLQPNGSLIPMGSENTFFPKNTYCSTTSTHFSNGLGCTAKALSDANYFKNLKM